MEFKNLPYELKSKIMYSGWLKHPISNLFNIFLSNIIPLSADVDKPDFTEHLRNIGELRDSNNFYWCRDCCGFHKYFECFEND